MRILFLTHRLPYPPNKGDKIRSFHILTHLAKQAEVHLACPMEDPEDQRWVGEVEGRCGWFATEPLSRFGRGPSVAKALLSGRAVTVEHFHSARLQQRIDRQLDEVRYDYVFCYSTQMAEYVFRSRHAGGVLRHTPLVMDFIDIDSLKWAQYAADAKGPARWIYRREARLLTQYERRIAEVFQRLFLVSAQEMKHFPGETGGKLQALSNGVDLDYFSPGFGPQGALEGAPLVFTGVMDYWPNVEGMVWFVREVLPLVRREVPEATLYIVGSKPESRVRELAATPGVTVTGFVDDVRQYVAGARVCIAPLRIARGIQNKVLEAMSMGKATVCTPQAIEGIQATAGVETLVAGDAPRFAEAVVALLRAPERAAQMGLAARRNVEALYSWSGNLKLLDALP